MLIETQRIAQKLGRIQSPPSGTKEELEGQRHGMSHKNAKRFNPLQLHKTKGKPTDLPFVLWSWRGLNPRPNREIPSFLHAYPSLSFRAKTRPGPQANALSPEDVTLGAGPPRVSPVVAAPPFRRVTGRVPPGDVSFLHLVPE